MRSAPYRGASPAEGIDDEARELAEFALQMHADRRSWAHEDFRAAIHGMLIGSTQLLLAVALSSAAGRFEGSLLMPLAVGLLLLALGVRRFARWRRAVREPS
jgi:hypothetical protein